MNLSWFVDPITKQYFDFQGVTGRQAFWMYILYYVIGYVIVAIVANLIHLWQLSSLYSLGLLLPTLGIEVRRLHDVGKSGWWVLIGLVPILGWIYLIYLYAQPSAAPYGGAPATA
jgi:uncharacterized membrane protein YhaH (DUF805 family)